MRRILFAVFVIVITVFAFLFVGGVRGKGKKFWVFGWGAVILSNFATWVRGTD